jgi:NlpC/P60 family
MDSVDQAESQAWRLWAKLAAPALLRCPVLGISVVLVVSTPLAVAARTLPRSQEFTSAEPTQRQLRVLHSYERYLARVRTQTVNAGRAVRFAYRQVGKPYQWGGAGPRTYDCSGLVMAAWRTAGLRLPHRADLQHRVIRRKVGLKHLRPGDLVFFSGDHHVGIYVGRHHFLHAPHTGTRVQRGTLSGWRLRVFAGAARPGAPAYHAWPHWVRALADQLGDHTKGHPHGRPPADHTRPDDTTALPQDTDPNSDVYPAQPPVDTPPAAPDATPDQTRQRGPANDGSPLLTMAARGGHHAVRSGGKPEPRPRGHTGSRPRSHRPRNVIKRQNDEQVLNRDFDGRDDGGDDGGDTGGDGLDLRSLLGDAP